MNATIKKIRLLYYNRLVIRNYYHLMAHIKILFKYLSYRYIYIYIYIYLNTFFAKHNEKEVEYYFPSKLYKRKE